MANISLQSTSVSKLFCGYCLKYKSLCFCFQFVITIASCAQQCYCYSLVIFVKDLDLRGGIFLSLFHANRESFVLFFFFHCQLVRGKFRAKLNKLSLHRCKLPPDLSPRCYMKIALLDKQKCPFTGSLLLVDQLNLKQAMFLHLLLKSIYCHFYCCFSTRP